MSDPAHAPAPAPVPGTERGSVVAVAAAWATGGVLIAVALWRGRDLWFFSDDWNIVAQWPSGRLLEPFNSHLSAVPVGLYQVLFHTVGLGDYLPYRLVGLVGLGVLGWWVWRYGADRAGRWPAVWAVGAVLWCSAGVTNVMFPFLVNFSIPVAAAAAIWWHLDRGTARHDLWASWWLVVALATSGLGLLAAVAVVVELALTRAPWRRWATFAPGPLLWLAWYLAFGVDAPANGGLGEVVPYALRMLWGGFVALGAGSRLVGAVVLVGVVAVAVDALRAGRLGARALAGAAAGAAFCGLTAWSRTGVLPAIPPDELRYRWTVAAFVVLTVVALLPRPGAPAAPRPVRRGVGLGATALVVAGAVVLVGDLGDWAAMVRAARPGLEAATLATEAGGSTLDRDRVIPLSFVPVHVGEYLDAVDELGSPVAGLDVASIGGRDDQRRAADAILAEAVSAGAETSAGGACGDGRRSVEVAPGALVAATTEVEAVVALRRFVREGDAEPATVALGPGTTVLALPSDPAGTRGERSYRLAAPAGVALSVCR